MDIASLKHLNPRECQRRIFIDSLYRELDKAASNVESKTSRMLKRANDLILVDRLSKDVCVDMLIMEGYDDVAARNCIESYASSETDDSVLEKYDYCFEDSRGRTFTGRELNDLVEASSEEEAMTIISKSLSDFDPPVSLVSVYKIG